MSDNLKLPEPFRWLDSYLMVGEFALETSYISVEEIVLLDGRYSTEEVRIILKAMEVAEATIKARNQPN